MILIIIQIYKSRKVKTLLRVTEIFTSNLDILRICIHRTFFVKNNFCVKLFIKHLHKLSYSVQCNSLCKNGFLDNLHRMLVFHE